MLPRTRKKLMIFLAILRQVFCQPGLFGVQYGLDRFWMNRTIFRTDTVCGLSKDAESRVWSGRWNHLPSNGGSHAGRHRVEKERSGDQWWWGPYPNLVTVSQFIILGSSGKEKKHFSVCLLCGENFQSGSELSEIWFISAAGVECNLENWEKRQCWIFLSVVYKEGPVFA